jgi:hypothetical protein
MLSRDSRDLSPRGVKPRDIDILGRSLEAIGVRTRDFKQGSVWTLSIAGGKAIQSVVVLASQVALGNKFKFSSPQPQRNPSFLPRCGTT